MLIRLAEILGSAGKSEEAKSAAEEAIQLCEQKGNVVLGREAQELLDELATVPSVRTSS
jgi:hypothetical protein